MSGRSLLRAFLALCAAMALVVLPGLQVAHAHPVSERRAPSTRASAGGGPSGLPSALELAALLQLDRHRRLPGKEGAGGAQPREARRAPTGGGRKTDGQTETYTYNALGALSTHAGVAVDHQRPRLSGGGSASAGLPATHGGQPVGLDAVGKVTSLQGMTLDWNRLGRLVGTTQAGVTTTYGHDSYFRRATQQRTGSPLELYLYEGPNVAAVASGAGVASIDRRFLYDDVDHPLWMWDRVTDAGVYFELDCIGNVRRLRGGARYGAGAPLPSDLGGYKYSAFGRSLPADAGTPAPVVDGVGFVQPLRWQGRWLDTATGIYDVRNRQWAPELGAFLSPDEFVFHGTTGTLWTWPGQNPIRWRDPRGRDQFSGDAIGESWMLERGDISSQQMQTAEAWRGGGVLGEFALLFGFLGGPAAVEAGAAAVLQRGLISNQGSLRMLAKVAAAAIGGARACGDPGYTGGGGPTGGRASPFSFHRTHGLPSRADKLQVQRIAESMAANGYNGPPVTIFEHNGVKYVLDGHHRLAAARLAGLSDVPFESVGAEELSRFGYRSVDELLWAAAEAYGR